MTIALLTASGISERIKQDIPKQFINIEDKPLIMYTLEAFEQHPSVDAILVVCLDGWHDILKAYSKQYNISKLKWVVSGGDSNHASIHNGLIELKKHCNSTDIIIIHDGNRPMISQDIISDGLFTFSKYGSAIAYVPCTEVVFKSETKKNPYEEIPREHLLRTQTPHIFSLEKLLWAHDEVEKRKIKQPSAACSLMKSLGENIFFFNGSEKNIKITTLDDIDIFRALLNLSERKDFKR